VTSVIVQDPIVREHLAGLFPGVRFLDLAAVDEPVHDDRVALIIGRPMPRDDSWMLLGDDAEYVHFTSTGYDELSPQWLAGRTLTTAKGTNAVPVAEFALACVLASVKNLPDAWDPGYRAGQRPLSTLEGARVAVLGYGTVGRRVVDMLLPFTRNISVFRRRVEEETSDAVRFTDDVDVALAGARHVILALELSEGTRGILDSRRIAALPAGAHVVNVGRAGLLDQEALRAAAAAGAVTASLDVTSPEPLGADHPLRRTPGIRVSPHVAWSGPQVVPNRLALVSANIRAWLEGADLKNVVLTPADVAR
jgi:phosphoglycerate dehydrogenase-like enzyme